MKVKVHGPIASVLPNGNIESFAPDQQVEVDDSNKELVNYYKRLAKDGCATILEDAKTPRTVTSLKKETK